jgi:ligand-binding sensor domain-containing protein
MHSPLRTVCEAKQKRAGWRFFACLVLLISMRSASFAASPEDRISQYGHTVWRIQDGYFAGSVGTVTQTTDGYIWVGTDAGLFKFDGVRFVR